MVHFIDAKDKSTLIREIYYDDQRMELTVVLTYTTCVYVDVRSRYFEMFSEVDSLGKYYLQFIKNKFKMAKKQAQADPLPQPKKTKADYGCNQSSDKKRYIKQRIKLNILNKDWLFIGEKNDVYADITLALLPDGTVDQYGNLGMITQDVPKSIQEAEKGFEKKDRTLGPILGNGFEFKPVGYQEDKVVMASDAESQDAVDNLPF
jgi:hypothetical protein